MGLKLAPLALEMFAVGLGGTECLTLGQQEVASEAVLDSDDVTHLSETSNALK